MSFSQYSNIILFLYLTYLSFCLYFDLFILSFYLSFIYLSIYPHIHIYLSVFLSVCFIYKRVKNFNQLHINKFFTCLFALIYSKVSLSKWFYSNVTYSQRKSESLCVCECVLCDRQRERVKIKSSNT